MSDIALKARHKPTSKFSNPEELIENSKTINEKKLKVLSNDALRRSYLSRISNNGRLHTPLLTQASADKVKYKPLA